jgi:hypothetical protein
LITLIRIIDRRARDLLRSLKRTKPLRRFKLLRFGGPNPPYSPLYMSFLPLVCPSTLGTLELKFEAYL